VEEQPKKYVLWVRRPWMANIFVVVPFIALPIVGAIGVVFGNSTLEDGVFSRVFVVACFAVFQVFWVRAILQTRRIILDPDQHCVWLDETRLHLIIGRADTAIAFQDIASFEAREMPLWYDGDLPKAVALKLTRSYGGPWLHRSMGYRDFFGDRKFWLCTKDWPALYDELTDKMAVVQSNPVTRI
jgi:hypothetical protein